VRPRAPALLAALAAGAALVLVGCQVAARAQGAAAPAPVVAPTDRLMVSLGDSYGAGYQPDADGAAGRTTTDGFAYRVAADADLRLVNFACSGITAHGMLHDRDCAAAALGPGGAGYGGDTQVGAATAFLAAHRDQVDLVTVVVGGNDVRDCLVTAAGDLDTDVDGGVLPCLRERMPALARDLGEVLTRVRAAVGPDVRVVGVGYPDVALGAWVHGDATEQAVAARTVGFFTDWFTPLLRSAYAAAGASFVDVMALTGGDGPLAATVDDPTWGTVPAPVAQVCALTWFCRVGDVHPTPEGHHLIADAVRGTGGPT
jgi:lysophospholipase L1-like esterase